MNLIKLEKHQEFAFRLKELMKEKKINTVDLEKVIGISNQSISNWLTSKSEPSLSSLRLLSVYFECSVDYLSGLKEE